MRHAVYFGLVGQMNRLDDEFRLADENRSVEIHEEFAEIRDFILKQYLETAMIAIVETDVRVVECVSFVMAENERAKSEQVLWVEVFAKIKNKLNKLVGEDAENEKLRENTHYVVVLEYLAKLAKNTI